jgi:signal transduction histidine kinase
MKERGKTGYRAFLITLVAVVASFLVATTLTLYETAAIRTSTREIVGNALPSIDYLLAARSELRRLQVCIERRTLSEPSPSPEGSPAGIGGDSSPQCIEGSKEQFQRLVVRYRRLPTLPGEQEPWAEIIAAAREVDIMTAQVLARWEAGDRIGARRLADSELSQAFDRAEEVLSRSERINAEQIRVLARTIDTAWQTAWVAALVLNGVSVVLALVLAVVATRIARKHARIQREYTREAEERLAEMELFAGRVAHDILSPLSAPLLALERTSRVSDERQREIAQKGLRGLNAVRVIVDGLLAFARAGARPEEGASADLAEVTSEVLAGANDEAEMAGVILTAVLPPEPQSVAASKGVLTSVLSNLVRNALKYMGERPEKRVTMRAWRATEHVHVEVIDTGPGLPPGLERQVFEPFFRARTGGPGGIGLGLATVKKLVEGHGGRVGVSSHPGEGSRFWFELPLAQEGPKEGPKERR